MSMSYIFSECSSLLSLPDISNWNTFNVNDMRYMFSECSSLSSLPDISKWNTFNVKDMNFMFSECSSLSSLPDISNGILLMFIILIVHFLNVHHYHLYLIFQIEIFPKFMI